MVIVEDTRQKPEKNADIREQLETLGCTVRRYSLPCGDYQVFGQGAVVVDTKQDLQEVYSNIIHDNVRFKNECQLAKDGGIRLVVLVTQGKIADLDAVHTWNNPRRKRWFIVHAAHQKGKMRSVKIAPRPPVSSEQLEKAMRTMTERYGVEWQFCDRAAAGEKIIAILQNNA